jgi:hypothetical protein
VSNSAVIITKTVSVGATATVTVGTLLASTGTVTISWTNQ